MGMIVNPSRFAGAGALSDPHWANVVLLLHMDGADGSTTITDARGHTVTAKNGAQLSTSNPKFGTACASFGGTGYLEVTSDPDFALGAGDFTIEFFVNPTVLSSDHGLISIGVWSTGLMTQFVSNLALDCYIQGTNHTASYSGTTGAWQHIAFVRSGNTLYLFADGAVLGTRSVAGKTIAQNRVTIGARDGGGDRLTGSIDEVRITKGVARYTSNFTVPSAPFPEG